MVVGNSAFASNQWAGLQRNGDLFMNTVNWLAQDEDLISIRPKSPTNRHVDPDGNAAARTHVLHADVFARPGDRIRPFIWLKRR